MVLGHSLLRGNVAPHPGLLDTILAELSPAFATLYSPVGRPSIPPEKLLRALLLQVLYSIRSERLLMEQLDYNLLFRWFVGLNMDDPVWDPTVFTKNRERLVAGNIAQAFFAPAEKYLARQGMAMSGRGRQPQLSCRTGSSQREAELRARSRGAPGRSTR
jgi:hypothetical protein